MPSVTFTAGATLTAAQMNQIGQDSDWTNIPTFTNSWTAGTRAPAYRKIGNRVQLRGLINAGTANAAFTLPTGFRPPQTVLLSGVNTAATVTAVTIDSAGVYTPQQAQNHSLDGISFYTD